MEGLDGKTSIVYWKEAEENNTHVPRYKLKVFWWVMVEINYWYYKHFVLPWGKLTLEYVFKITNIYWLLV